MSTTFLMGNVKSIDFVYEEEKIRFKKDSFYEILSVILKRMLISKKLDNRKKHMLII